MAIDKLGIYNNALQIIGERRLSSLTEDRKPRHELDAAYNLDAVDYCLEVVAPAFARKVAVLNSPATSSTHTLTNTHTLPSDYVTTVGMFLDSELDQPIDRFIREGDTVSCDYSTVYLHYISNGYDISIWDSSFARVVAAYLAREITGSINAKMYETADAVFNQRVEAAKALVVEKDGIDRARAASGTLSAPWIKIYNDALAIMGLASQKITSGDTDSMVRSVMDVSVDAGLVEDILEDTGWHWANTTQKVEYNPSVTPSWGYRYAFDIPNDMQRFDGIWYDEYLSNPLKRYQHESDVIYADVTEIYIKYVSSDFLTNPASWPYKFRRLVAAKLAMDSAPSVPGADVNLARQTYQERENEAKASDAQQSPPRILGRGQWLRARMSNHNYDRNR